MMTTAKLNDRTHPTPNPVVLKVGGRRVTIQLQQDVARPAGPPGVTSATIFGSSSADVNAAAACGPS